MGRMSILVPIKITNKINVSLEPLPQSPSGARLLRVLLSDFFLVLFLLHSTVVGFLKRGRPVLDLRSGTKRPSRISGIGRERRNGKRRGEECGFPTVKEKRTAATVVH